MRQSEGILAACAVAACMLAPPAVAADSYETRGYGVDRQVETLVFQPLTARNGKLVLALHTSSGLRDGDIRYAERLAEQGYVVMVPAFMKRYDITESTRRATWQIHGRAIYADFLAMIDEGSRDFAVPKDRIYAVGFSNGGYWAALLAARGDVRAGVSYYGAFTEAGMDPSLATFRHSFKAESSPLLILHGNNDQTVAVRYAEELLALVRRSGGKVEAHFFKDVGHSFDRAQQNDPSYSGAAETAFEFTIKFLAEN